MQSTFLLLILDGWGVRETLEHNAIAAADTPTWDKLLTTYPHTTISGSGMCVGLPQGQMGNSEVGHLNIGAGRVVYQDYTRIEKAVSENEFEKNQTFLSALEKAVASNKAVHVLGLLSPGGVHSHETQIQALLQVAVHHGVKKLYLHAFLDGRDTPPQSAMASLETTHALLQKLGTGKIASVIGRYYAMDRDKRWERISAAYELLVAGVAQYHAKDPMTALSEAYNRGETDEFVKATVIHDSGENPITIEDNDVVIFMNFRADRARELSLALIDQHFTGFVRNKIVKLADFVTLTQYADYIPSNIAYPPLNLHRTLGEYLSELGLKQLRIAETEKYAHVTFFFNGGVEKPFLNEDRILIPSAKVSTYDLKPEMSAIEITDELVNAINSKKYDFIVCNFANPDMVGHTGNFTATVKAITLIDQCLARLVEALKNNHGEMIVTADHGNAECMFDNETKQPHTAHTHEPVPFIYVGRSAKIIAKNGSLSDIAPTILHLMNLPIPNEMSGNLLLELN